ncbi:MAG: GAF and ANTAR domain-containing protein [Geodermatophilaceae bacterium]|nr:GAF and ANTAR domain-containing protein [Geodermatophilaceae bacterium]
MVRSPRVSEILASLSGGGGDRAVQPDRLCQECAAAVAVSGVALALMTADGPSGGIVAATDGAAKQMEELQFALGEGPCVDASRSGRPVLQPDILATAVGRWPAFGPGVLAAGIRAIFAFPLRVGAIRLGVLDLYRDTPGGLSAEELLDALAFADAATVVLLHLQHQADAGGAQPMLAGAFDDRAEVHQATGMITIQLNVSLANALVRLRAHAYATERPIGEIAADVVNRRLRFDHSDAGSSRQDPG